MSGGEDQQSPWIRWLLKVNVWPYSYVAGLIIACLVAVAVEMIDPDSLQWLRPPGRLAFMGGFALMIGSVSFQGTGTQAPAGKVEKLVRLGTGVLGAILFCLAWMVFEVKPDAP